ncbi:MAG: vWA domain-containing protein [Nannocystaceae bacterium]|nr:VWA domain-containing protein [bacterium]
MMGTRRVWMWMAVVACGCGGESTVDNVDNATGGIDTITSGLGSTSMSQGSTGAESNDDTTGEHDASSGTASTETSSGGPSSTGAANDGSSSSDGTTSGVLPESSGSTMDCPSAEVQFEPVIPTVILLIDQSGSMTTGFDGTNRWDAVRTALIDPETGVIAALQDTVSFGLALYTSNGGDEGGQCPVINEVDPFLGNLDAISLVYADESPTGDTPTGDSVDAVVAALGEPMSDDPRIIVLATDGEPDTCEVPNPQEGQVEAVTAVENAFTEDIQTFVISVGNDVSETHLQDLANAGVGWMPGDPDAPFYVPSDQDAMVAAFEEIINGVRSCVLTLDTAILPGQADQGTVTINGVEIPFDDPNGWQVNGPTEIELLGTSCEAIQEGDVEISVEFTCEAIVPG